jgi:hypothetical protein
MSGRGLARARSVKPRFVFSGAPAGIFPTGASHIRKNGFGSALVKSVGHERKSLE